MTRVKTFMFNTSKPGFTEGHPVFSEEEIDTVVNGFIIKHAENVISIQTLLIPGNEESDTNALVYTLLYTPITEKSEVFVRNHEKKRTKPVGHLKPAINWDTNSLKK